MRYYSHHIGDYRARTAHLTMLEDGAYRRLLDIYYMREQPLPADMAAVQRLAAARTKEERAAVESVLNEFFVLQDDGWHQGRADEELETHRVRASASRDNGKGGGRPKKKPSENLPGYSRVSDDNPDETLTINHNPRTNNQPEACASGRARSLPGDWEPGEADLAEAKRSRPDLSDADLVLETQRFRRHAKGNNRTSFHWGSSWLNWISKAELRANGPPGESYDQRRIREAREAVQ